MLKTMVEQIQNKGVIMELSDKERITLLEQNVAELQESLYTAYKRIGDLNERNAYDSGNVKPQHKEIKTDS